MEVQEDQPILNSNRFQIGKYWLEYPEGHRKKKPIHKEAIKQLKDQQKDILDLSWGKYKRYKWDKIFKYIKQTSIERISACMFQPIKDGNTDKKMLVQISKVNFLNLTYLDLRDCQLENIEALPSGPNLNFLSLDNNNIYTVKTLKKCQLSDDNPISTLELERCNFQLQTLWLERKYNSRTIQESLCRASIFKLKNSLKEISIESQKRIFEEVSLKKIHEKYLSLERLLYIDPDNEDYGQIEFINYLSDSDDDMIPVENDYQEEIQPPPLHDIAGQDQEDWLTEINDQDEKNNLKNQQNSDSGSSWEQ